MRLIKSPLTLVILVAALLLFTTTAAAQISPKGHLHNGGSFSGMISPAFDVDSYAFPATQGESILLTMADFAGTGLDPQMNLYKPDGSLLDWDWGNTVAGLEFVAPVTGVYILVVRDYNNGSSTGPYRIHYTRAPGANEHGALVNGGTVSQTIDVGDLDSYTFTATQGEGILLRMVDLNGTGLDPQINVYNPDGSLLDWDWANTVAGLDFAAPVTGVYTVVVRDYNVGANSGAYQIHYARVPAANEHGALVNGGTVSDTIDVGDLDSYIFTATQGEGILLRMVDLGGTGLDPQMNVYNPDGSFLYSDWANTVAGLDFVAPATGVYTLIVMDYNIGSSSGAYEIHYTNVPGVNEHGALVNGGAVSETIDVGDLDSYIFTATQGENILLRMVDLGGTGLDPQMNVYKPDGSLLYWDWGNTVAGLGFAAPVTGVYTLIVMDYNIGPSSGAYEIHYARIPGANEHGSLINGGTVSETIDRGDLDSFTFTATQGNPIHLQMTDLAGTGLDPQVSVYKPDGSLLYWDWGNTIAELNFAAPVTGVYTVVAMDYNVGASSGAYEIYFTR